MKMKKLLYFLLIIISSNSQKINAFRILNRIGDLEYGIIPDKGGNVVRTKLKKDELSQNISNFIVYNIATEEGVIKEKYPRLYLDFKIGDKKIPFNLKELRKSEEFKKSNLDLDAPSTVIEVFYDFGNIRYNLSSIHPQEEKSGKIPGGPSIP